MWQQFHPLLLSSFIISALALPPSLSFAQDFESVDDELEDLLREFEEGTNSTEASSARVSPTTVDYLPISLIADFALSWFSDAPELSGGHDPAEFGFNLQGLELNLAGAVDPYFRFDGSILFTMEGVEIEEAYATAMALPGSFQLRAGQFLTNFGRANPTHLHAWNFALLPLGIAKFFGGDQLRGLGLEVSQILPLPWTVQWSLSAQNIAGEYTGRSFLPSTDDIEDFHHLSAAARLEQFFALSRSLDLLFGLSAIVGPGDLVNFKRSEIYGADLLLKLTPLTGAGGYKEVGWQSEGWLRRRHDDSSSLDDWAALSELYFSPSRFWRFAARYEIASGLENDPLDPDWTQTRQRASANISLMPTHFSRIRLEYVADNMPYRTELSPLVHMAFLQLELVAGAHGAHTY